MDNELRFDYNDYWSPEESESNYVEESYDAPSDQDFWELHRFVLECELESYDDIYAESVGSTLKAAAGTVADKIVEIFLRICEAFKKKSMKKAIRWLSKNSTIIGRISKFHRPVRNGLETAMHGYQVINVFMTRFKKLAETNTSDTAAEKLNKELEELSNAVKEEVKKSTSIERSMGIIGMVANLESGSYDNWYGIAQDFRVTLKKINRKAQLGGGDAVETTGQWLQLPKMVLGAFDEITKGIKSIRDSLPAELDENTISMLEKNVDDLDKIIADVHKTNERMRETEESIRKTKAETDALQRQVVERLKKSKKLTDENQQSLNEITGESYYVSFEPEVDILF